MCGIAGVLKFSGENVKEAEVVQMLDIMPYRGPDDRGVFLNDGIALGHLRLSVIDLSNAGHQPMRSQDITIVYNGEIYNYIELRESLKKCGKIFKTNSDTEVILRAYEEWGENCVEKFNGMWAFAIYDKKRNILFCSRDRFGVKPFFYYFDGKEFIFASEMKAILRIRPALKKPDYKFLYNFLDRNTPFENQQTVFTEILSLLPGHNMVVGLNNGQLNIKKYWEFEITGLQKKYNYENPTETLRNLLIDAVKLRLRSDVPVGVCLSGGLDSSVINCIISKVFGIKTDSFSSIYNQPEYSEEKFIDIVNDWCGNRPHKISPDTSNFVEILKSVIFHHDQPVRMPSCYSQWHVMKLAMENKVTVLLDGQGGDELLGGYVMYYPYYLASLAKELLYLRKRGEIYSEFLAARRFLLGKYPYGFTKDVIKMLMPNSLFKLLRVFKSEQVWQDSILSDDFKNRVTRYNNNYPVLYKDPFNQELFKTFFGTNLPMILDYEDRLSMAFSLESRTPMLDYRFVEFCLGLSRKYKMKTVNNQIITKFLLREAFKDILPTEISGRKDKKGFPTPNEYWFRNELRDFFVRMIESASFREHNIFDQAAVKSLFCEHLRGKNNSRLLWRVLTVELWQRQYFD